MNIAASVRIARTDVCAGKQGLWQLGLVWLLPIIGATLTSLVLKQPDSRARRSRTEVDHDHWENAQDRPHGVE
jgi:hypothetical protein